MINLNLVQDIVSKIKIDINEIDILDALQNRKRWPQYYPWGQPSVEIINNNENSTNFFFEIDGYLDYEKWKNFYNLGYTTIISNVLDLNNDLRKLDKLLIDATGLKINANLYFSQPGQIPSFSKHLHNYDVIVKQIYGESSWVIDNKEFIIQKNDTCLIPKNTYHQVISKKNKKLSLTINIQ